MSIRYTTIIISALMLNSCMGNSINSRIDTAYNIAAHNNLKQEYIETDNFKLSVFQKIAHPNSSATIYIEGDGLAWLTRTTPSRNPTPKNPVALSLAANDTTSKNIIYMARPCQYTPINNAQPCHMDYWTSKRFAPEVIESFNQALDKIKQRNAITSFNLVGYSGGAAIAIILAAKRNDIATIRTVAGNINVSAFNHLHNVSQMPQSLDPANYAVKVRNIAQMHFIGSSDKIVPISIFNSFKNKSGYSKCIKNTIITQASHSKGWVKAWNRLLNIPILCK